MTITQNVVRFQGALYRTCVSILCYRIIEGCYEHTVYKITDGDVGELLHLFNNELLPVDLAHLS